MADLQKTLKSEVVIEGIGLHTGKKSTIRIKPAPENHWFKFQRVDLPDKPIIPADADYVIDTSRGTTLGIGDATVHTTEHLLAALLGLEIDNALIEIDGPEIPILDGSAYPFVEAIQKAGIQEQKMPKNYWILKENITYEDTERKIEMLAVPQDEFRITVMVDYNSPILGTQHASMYNIREFVPEISRCRTFVFFRELEQLAKRGLIKGGDLSNAIVLVDKPVSQEELDELSKLLNKPKVEIKGIGILNNVQPHFYNEPARHKLLDIVGDFALIGQPIKAHILAARPGHYGNVAFSKIIKKTIKEEKKKAPVIDVNQPSILTVEDIKKRLPHRFPFLLVDKIIELTDNYVIGVKNVTYNEAFFQGHFPDEPIMPGVLQIEALAQTGGVLVMKNIPDPENYSTYFLKVENFRFKNKVVPGDTLILKMEMLEPVKRGISYMRGTAYVGDKIVSEGNLMAQIVKVKNT
jgi:UDP-3-O-[3-hydroxymyristoyl] N-acetylglucosamine deacetylase/3-hydroxyacyl-[acyl-carrier-protein] dehydratase